MSQEELIPANDFCTHHRIEVSFLQSLQEYGLVELTTVQETPFLHSDQLAAVEKFMHLHYDLDINFEGLDVIRHLLQRMEDLQQELALVKSKLRFRETAF